MEYTVIPSPLGPLTVAAEAGAVTGLWMEGQKYFGSTLGADAVRRDDAPALEAARAWLEAYFAGRRPGTEGLVLAPRGTDFQRRVWDALREIPYGGTETYGALAARLGSAPRAVGSAAGRNPISILLPCHRLVAANGALAGYAGGLERKRFLLRLEAGTRR